MLLIEISVLAIALQLQFQLELQSLLLLTCSSTILAEKTNFSESKLEAKIQKNLTTEATFSSSIEGLVPIIEDNYEFHPCLRECSTDSSTFKTCEYQFQVNYFWASSFECRKCPNVTDDCSRLNCIFGDGRKRPITVVNHMLPGPAIRVCEGDTVVVSVTNHLPTEGTAIHWHGVHQKKSPWMDGVPGVTQCLISPGATFKYEFDVPIGGTYFWHSHAGFQRGDGIFGSLVVRKAKENEPNGQLYEFDLPEHEIIVMDWQGEMGMTLLFNFQYATGNLNANGALVNGKGLPQGFFRDFFPNETMQTRGKTKPFAPLHEIRIEKDRSYRIRLVNNAVYNCPFEVSIENHTMLVIASDAMDIEPVLVSSLVIASGERYDFVLKGDQPVGSYWIKFKGLLDCDNFFPRVFQLALLTYVGVDKGTLPQHSIKSWEESSAVDSGAQLNTINQLSLPGKYVSVTDLRAINDDDPEILRKEKADHQFYLSFDFNRVPHWNLGRGFSPSNLSAHKKNLTIKDSTVKFKPRPAFITQFNFISHHNPPAPPLTQPEILSMKGVHLCNESFNEERRDCGNEFCKCVHLLKVELDSIVEMIFVDRGHFLNSSHPIHLHGHSFRVVSMGKLGSGTEVKSVQEQDDKNMIQRIRSKAPVKDTVSVHDGGYTIIRFRADNPGFWFLHCHIENHVEEGMALILQVGEISQMMKAPPGFPKCGSFT